MKAEYPAVEQNFRAMGTDVSVEIVLAGEDGQSAAEAAALAVKNIFDCHERIFSRFDPNSELSKMNQNLSRELPVSAEMFAVLKLCLKFHELSEGYFDPRIIDNLEQIGYDKDFRSHDLNSAAGKEISFKIITGGLQQDLVLNQQQQAVLIKKRIDTTGIAKGWTVDAAADYLQKGGFENFVVDAGGDMFAAGRDRKGKAWRIGIEGLADQKLMLRLEDEGIATSGISRKRWQIGEKKFHHLINPKEPENFSFDIKTVTVIEDKTVEADGRAKVLVILGKEKGMRFANENKIKALFLDYRGNVYLSEQIKSHIINH